MKNKKKTIALLLFVISFVMIIGTSLAYFSDVVKGTGTLKAGTLDITGSLEMYVNRSETPVTSIENFNPGDIVVVKTNITNGGNKSAHIRTVLNSATSTFTPGMVKIASGEKTATQMEELSTSMTIPFESTPKIINGTGANAETETNGVTKYEEVFTLYFDEAATNAEQGKTLTLDFTVQAMQYRNNSTPVWSDVVTEAFSLGD